MQDMEVEGHRKGLSRGVATEVLFFSSWTTLAMVWDGGQGRSRRARAGRRLQKCTSIIDCLRA